MSAFLRQDRPRGEMPDAEPPSLWPGIAVSFLLHAAVVFLILNASSLGSTPRIPPGGAIQVNLVSAPGPGGPPGPPAAQPEAATVEKAPAAEAPAPAPAPVREIPPPPPVARAAPEPPKPEVSLAPKPMKEKKSLKEATKDPRKLIDRAIERIEKKVAEPEPGASVAQAIEQLKKKLAEEEKRTAAAGAGGAGAGATPGSAGTGSGGGGGGGGASGPITPVDIYRAAIAAQIERNWAFSPQLAGGNRNLRVGLVFKVLPNGEITDIRFTERSNNAYLDDSAYKAILKSNPVPPHPPSVKEPFVLVAIRFTPEGIR